MLGVSSQHAYCVVETSMFFFFLFATSKKGCCQNVDLNIVSSFSGQRKEITIEQLLNSSRHSCSWHFYWLDSSYLAIIPLFLLIMLWTYTKHIQTLPLWLVMWSCLIFVYLQCVLYTIIYSLACMYALTEEGKGLCRSVANGALKWLKDNL